MKIALERGKCVKLEAPTPLKELPKILELNESSIYKVNLSMRAGNPWHEGLLITGFMGKNSFGGYCELINCQGDPLDFASETLRIGSVELITKYEMGHTDLDLPY